MLLYSCICFLLFVATSESVSPTCALNYPCPPPTWPVQWQLNLSTICQPAVSGYFLPPATEPWGLISLDWSNAESIWINKDLNKTNCEEVNTNNAKQIKATSPGTRVFIYKNMELALQWLESQRKYMYNPDYAHIFLQYTDGKGNKNGTIYNEARGEGDQYFWDFREPDAVAAFIEGTKQVVDSEYVDGIFTDDVTGLPAEHQNAADHMKLTAQELVEIQAATQKASQAVIDYLIGAGKYNWQAFSAQDDVGPAPGRANCIPFMRQYCNPALQKNPMTMRASSTYAKQVLAAFLITRPPYAWLGFGWESDQRYWDPLFDTDVGVPEGLCTEGPTGVFSRKWSATTVSLNCNTWEASL